MVLDDSTLWEDWNGATPPESWESLQADGRFWFHAGLVGAPSRTSYIGTQAALPASLTIPWEITEAPVGENLFFKYDYTGTAGTQTVDLGNAIGSGEVVLANPQADLRFWITGGGGGADSQASGIIAIGTAPTPPISYNCECDDDDVEIETLAALRRRLAIRLGYASQADNLTPGMVILLNDFLLDAQKILYKKVPALRTERFFSWTLEPGVRFYGIRENDDECSKKLDPYLVTWVGIEDLNGQWYELREGIPPEFYTSITNHSWPTRYEIRQCIEVFPPPAGAYKLRVKGRFGLLPFTDDADKTTLPASPVFHWALGMGKRHYSKPDANDYFDIALEEIGAYVAGSHGTRRYVPGPRRDAPPLPKPVMKGGFE